MTSDLGSWEMRKFRVIPQMPGTDDKYSAGQRKGKL